MPFPRPSSKTSSGETLWLSIEISIVDNLIIKHVQKPITSSVLFLLCVVLLWALIRGQDFLI